MNRKAIILIAFLFLIAGEALSQRVEPNPEGLNLLRGNLEILASDEMGGREATTHSEDLAAQFISSKLMEYGIMPFGDDNTYYQNFEVNVKGVDSTSFLEFVSADESVSRFTVGEDFYLSTALMPSEKINHISKGIVFAGFGISAPEYDHDDYENLDVNGKVVLIYRTAPTKDGEKIFSPEDHKYFSDPKYKIRNAADHGAAGLLIIPSDFAVKYWKWIKRRAISPTFTLAENSVEEDISIPSVLLSVSAASKLLDKERFSYEDLLEALNDEEIPEWFLLSKKIKFNYKTFREKRNSKNIIGIINGTDKDLSDEFVTIGAHYDHEGIVNGEVYNGADDNASGVVAILEAGRRLNNLKSNRRSILIIFHAAEEKGLLGSKYLTTQSSLVEDIVVHINLDMVGREHIDTIYSVGSDKLSMELKQIVEEVNSETVRFNFNYKFDDPEDPQRIYYRSDHYNYAKKGIPIVFFYDYMLEDYHKPSDDVDKINYKKIEKVSTLITGIAQKVANLDHHLSVDMEEVTEKP